MTDKKKSKQRTEYYQTDIDCDIIRTDRENAYYERIIRAADGLEADKYLMQFCNAGFGRSRIIRLLNHFGSVREAYNAETEALAGSGCLSMQALERFCEIRRSFAPDEEWERLRERGIGFTSFISKDYPEKLENIPDPPAGLFAIGKLPSSNTPSVAMVGSRECSNYGREIAINMAKRLAGAGIDIISGMAAGIDGYSHRGALNGGGDTFAVLGCGVDVCYPAFNRDIYLRIQKQGGIISEYYPGTKPLSHYFPRRNRLISGLADAILVVEARKRSGSWITVDFGLDQGRDVYAVPGRVGDRLSEGCNNLIRCGAKPVTSADDIIKELAQRYIPNRKRQVKRASGVLTDKEAALKAQLRRAVRENSDIHPGDEALYDKEACGGMSDQEMKIYACLEPAGTGVEEIICSTGLNVREVIKLLSMLEIKGKCVRLGNSIYARK